MLEIKENFKIENIYAAGIFQNEKPTEVLNGLTDRIEAVFVMSGKLTASVGKNIYECKAGTAAIFKSGEMHFVKLSSAEYTEYLLVSFSASNDDLLEFSLATELTVLQKQLVLNICNHIAAENEQNVILPDIFKNNSVVAKLAATLELLTLDISSNSNKLQKLSTRDALLFERAVKEMEKNVLGKLSIEDLANKLEISLSHLKRIFASFTDVGVHEYYMCLKIIKAIELLKSGKSVTETAELTGFNNQNYFSAAFKRITGTSPKEYCYVGKRKALKKTVKVNTVKMSKPTVEKKAAADMPSYLL